MGDLAGRGVRQGVTGPITRGSGGRGELPWLLVPGNRRRSSNQSCHRAEAAARARDTLYKCSIGRAVSRKGAGHALDVQQKLLRLVVGLYPVAHGNHC